ncbi:MAG: tetratricopeptide repeat protein [Magnetococcales bacterium]|nr:tetratricopeptide repeat protein [Magnetococcales bacterium]
MRPEAALRQAVALHQAGRLTEAEQRYREVLRVAPGHPDANHNLGLLAAATGRPELALSHLRAAMRAVPTAAPLRRSLVAALFDHALRLHQEGWSDEAEPLYREILTLDAGHADALHLSGMIAHQRGDWREATEWIGRAIAVNDQEALYFANLGVVYRAWGKLEEAEAGLRRAVGMQPDNADWQFQLGVVLRERNQPEEAVNRLQRACDLCPQHKEAERFLIALLMDLGRMQEAETCMRRILQHDPARIDVLNDLGLALSAQGRHSDAVVCYRQLLASRPEDAVAWNNLGAALWEWGRPQEAMAAFRKALAIRPDYLEPRAGLLAVMQTLCDWRGLAAVEERLTAQSGEGGMAPFVLLFMPVSPLEMRAHAARHLQRTLPVPAPQLVVRAGGPEPERLRIGYLSGDFRNHPVAYQIAGLLEAHARERFEIIAYSSGPDDGQPQRRRIVAACDRFVDIRSLSHAAAARRIREDGVHLLVDLQGLTRGNRLEILALRPAPVQVTWLGYPGTLGMPGIADYLIGDPVITPPGHAAHFCETLALLPHCYLPPGDNQADVCVVSRAQAGLPEEGFVFCSFNQGRKFNPETFAVWCRLLEAIPGAVLWLKEQHPLAREHLRREARELGIDPERLVFAPKTPTRGEHLGRLRLADLALDTFPYNSHATGCDALWSGVPLITRSGETFPSRVGASLLCAAGLREGIVEDWEGYFRLAVELARHPERLATLRERLVAGRATSPLFDTPGFARDLERLYERMWRDHRAGRRELIRGA